MMGKNLRFAPELPPFDLPPVWLVAPRRLVLPLTRGNWILGELRDGSGWKFKGGVVSLLPMGYLAFLMLSFLVATGCAKPKAVCDLDISKGRVKA